MGKISSSVSKIYPVEKQSQNKPLLDFDRQSLTDPPLAQRISIICTQLGKSIGKCSIVDLYTAVQFHQNRPTTCVCVPRRN